MSSFSAKKPLQLVAGIGCLGVLLDEHAVYVRVHNVIFMRFGIGDIHGAKSKRLGLGAWVWFYPLSMYVDGQAVEVAWPSSGLHAYHIVMCV